MAIIKGLRAGFILLGLGLAIGYLAGSFALKPLPLAGFFSILIWLLPVVAGVFSGWYSPNKAWKNGALSGITLWFCQALFLFWFLPQLLKAEPLLTGLVYCLGVGALGGVFGLNLRLAKIKQDNRE